MDTQNKANVFDYKQEFGTRNRFDVDCDWTQVNASLEDCCFEQYKVYPTASNITFAEFEERVNLIVLNNYPPNDSRFDNTTRGSCEIAYGALRCNSVQSMQSNGERFFTEPMIQVYFYNSDENEGEAEPDQLMGYRAVYSLDGELALEEGEWFLNVEKTEYCRRYFNTMLQIIGKSN